MTPPLLGTAAVVGFPNVGKSTLVNRLSATRQAVVFETPGVTRDRKEIAVEWAGKRFLLVDTGGVDIADDSPITRQVAEQARRAVEEADLVLFVVDAKAGIGPGDQEIAAILRRARKPVLVLANKIDDPRLDDEAVEFHALGLGDPIPVSAVHGHGTGDLLDRVAAELEQIGAGPPDEVGEDAIRVAILGRPNVGKSSLLNAIAGEERVIVSDVPGTTRDAIDTVVKRGDTTFVFVDTAGLRRKRRQRQGIEYYSELRAIQAAERADICLVLVDSTEGIVDQDLAVADVARTAGCATLVVLSKWDADDGRPRGRPAAARRPAAPASAGCRRVRAHGPWAQAPARPDRGALLPPHRARADRAAEHLPPGAPPAAAGTEPPRPPAQPPLRDAGVGSPAALSHLRQRSRSHDPRLRLLGREPDPRAVRPGRRSRRDRLREAELMRAVVVGGGSWGSTFAALLAEREHEVVLACRDPEQAAAIADTGRNPRYVRGLDLSRVTPCLVADAPFADADVIVVAVPSRSFHDVVDGLPPGVPVLSLVKGLDPVTGDRLSRALADRPFAVLSGPNHAEEIADGLPAAAVIASENETLATTLQHEIISPSFRVYVNADLVGVELCAAAKNVIALGAGAVDGLGHGRQRQGGADHARPLRDDAAGGWIRRAARDVLRARRDGRPDRHVLEPPQPQPPRGRADRARRLAGRGPRRDRDGGRGPHDCAASARPRPRARASSCRSRRPCAACSRARASAAPSRR